MKGTSILIAVMLFYAVASAQQAPAPAAGRQGGARQGGAAAAGGGRATRPPIFLKEEWQQTPANDEHPVTQQSIGNPNLELKLYGSTSKEVQLTGRSGDENNPTHVWTGTCSTPCAVALRDKANFADLSGLARIRWNTKTSGYHQIRPMVKLADGNVYVGDQ